MQQTVIVEQTRNDDSGVAWGWSVVLLVSLYLSFIPLFRIVLTFLPKNWIRLQPTL